MRIPCSKFGRVFLRHFALKSRSAIVLVVIFRRSFLEKKIIKSNVCVFPFPEIARDAQTLLQSRYYLDENKYVGITVVKKIKVAGANPALRHNFSLFLDTLNPFFLYRFFRQKFWFFDK